MVLMFLFFSFLSICPGLYFRRHYYVLLLPAVALLAGACSASIGGFFARRGWKVFSKIVPVVVVFLALFHSVFYQRTIFFKMTPAEVTRLHKAIRVVLTSAIAGGGTTLEDEAYRRANGRVGEFAGELAAYGRAGQPCPRCSQTIERIKVSQRGTHFCPRCQPVQKKKLKIQGIDSETNKA